MLFVNKIFLEADAGFNSTEREDDGSISVNAQLLSPAFFENITPDSEVSEAVSELLEQQESTVNEVVAQSASTVWGGLIKFNLGDMDFSKITSAKLAVYSQSIGKDRTGDITIHQ